MQKMNNALLESFLSENVKKGSQKVWRSNIKKIITLQDENPQVVFLNDLISILKSDPRWDLADSTCHTIEKNTNSFLSWLKNHYPTIESPKVESPKVEEPTEIEITVETESSESIKEGLRQKQEALKISCERQALLEKEAKEESARLEAVLEKEAEEFAQKEAIRKEEASKKRLEQLFGNFESEEIQTSICHSIWKLTDKKQRRHTLSKKMSGKKSFLL